MVFQEKNEYTQALPSFERVFSRMSDDAATHFLRWALPRLGKRPNAYDRVQGQVKSRMRDRLHELRLRSFEAYQRYLVKHPEEWTRLDTMCRITISRFYRDPSLFDALRTQFLPRLARLRRTHGPPRIRALSLGAASGEEPYTLRLLWRHDLRDSFTDLSLHVTATEVQAHMLRRAQNAWYAHGSLRNLPDEWIERAFRHDPVRANGRHAEPYVLHPLYRRGISWRQEDVRATLPDGPFSLIFCRNLVFTYFDGALQRWILKRLLTRLRPQGLFVLGKKETLPGGNWPLTPIHDAGLYEYCLDEYTG